MWKKLYRKLKYEYFKLVRMKGAPSIIARGFSIGIFVEFITLPTFGLAFLLLWPLNILFRSSFSASLIGFVIGKFILPAFMMLNLKIGNILIGKPPTREDIEQSSSSWAEWLAWMKHHGLAYFTGSAVVGVLVAVGSYFIVYLVLRWYRKKRERRSLAASRS